MQYPNWTNPQFLDANGAGGLNNAFGVVSGSIAAVGSGIWATPGLLMPEVMTVTNSGMVATINLPRPWGLVTTSGVVVRAHGTVTNQDTTQYTASFAPLVPATGSVTAFALATLIQIQQNSFPIPGPPTGDPAYNPNFIPGVGYATNAYSISVSGTLTPANNTTTFELYRTILTPGQATLTAPNTRWITRAGVRLSSPVLLLNAPGAITVQNAQYVVSANQSGITSTLPPVDTATDLTFRFVSSTTSAWTIVTSGADTITGIHGTTLDSSIVVPGYGAITLYSNGFNYEALSVSPNMITTVIGNLGGVLTGTLPNPGMAAGAAAANIGALGGVLTGTLPNPGMTAGAASANVGALGGALAGTLPNPTLAAGAASGNLGFMPVQQGGGTGQLTNKVYIGYDGSGNIKAQVDTTDFGALAFKPVGGVLTGTLPSPGLAAGAAVANIGYTPVNRAGDIMSGGLTAPTMAATNTITAVNNINSTAGSIGAALDVNANRNVNALGNVTTSANGDINSGRDLYATRNIASTGYMYSATYIQANGNISSDTGSVAAHLDVNANRNVNAATNVNAGADVHGSQNVYADNGGVYASNGNIQSGLDIVAGRNFYTNTGSISTNSGNIATNNGSIYAINGSVESRQIVAHAATYFSYDHNAGFSANSDVNYNYFSMSSDNWGWIYVRASGQFYYQNNTGTQLFSIDGTGKATAYGDLAASNGSVGAGLDISAGRNMYAAQHIGAGNGIDSYAGNITANSGRLRASYGAYGQGDAAVAVILSDFNWGSNGNGSYLRLPNGIIMQWFSGSANRQQTDYYSFPTGFPNACLAIVGSLGSNIQLNGFNIILGIEAQNQYVYMVTIGATTPNTGQDVGFSMFAIGY